MPRFLTFALDKNSVSQLIHSGPWPEEDNI